MTMYVSTGWAARAFDEIARLMEKHREELIELDSRAGDGDLGISMYEGFAAVAQQAAKNDSDDLGQMLRMASKTLNRAAPSSLGTILSMGLLGAAGSIRGKTMSEVAELAQACRAGVNAIEQRTGAKPGEKTVLDALLPGVLALEEFEGEDLVGALEAASTAAWENARATKGMLAVHGRAGRNPEKSRGEVDGGAVVAALLFEGAMLASRGCAN